MRFHSQHTRLRWLCGRIPHARGGRGGVIAHQAGASGDGTVHEAWACFEDSGLHRFTAP